MARIPPFEVGGSGETGRTFERGLFGVYEPSDPATYEAELHRLQAKDPRGRGFVNFDESLDLVRKFTKEDPTNPNKNFLRDLRLEILDAIGRGALLPDDAVLAYGSLGTPFDHWHKADAFLVIKQSGREEIIRIDASQRPEKAEAAAAGESKVDIFIGENDVPDAVQAPDEYLEAIARFADQVLIVLAERRRQQGDRPAGA